MTSKIGEAKIGEAIIGGEARGAILGDTVLGETILGQQPAKERKWGEGTWGTGTWGGAPKAPQGAEGEPGEAISGPELGAPLTPCAKPAEASLVIDEGRIDAATVGG